MVRILRNVIVSVIGLGLLASALAVWAVNTYLVEDLNDKVIGPVVAALPPGYARQANLPSYDGPHPSRLQRPEDHFEYPIALGEIGPDQPLFAGPKEYPWLCQTLESRLGQPIVDNQDGVGTPVFDVGDQGQPGSEILGYSRDCLIKTRAAYFYNRKGTRWFYPLRWANDDIKKINIDGREIDFVIRVEVGTINRFLYIIAALRGPGDTLKKPDPTNWNRRLVYQFRGGVGIGKRQGKLNIGKSLNRKYNELARGFGLAYSTANETSNHYNIWLAEDTALRVKRQFEALYGKAKYTIGFGGSGGAIQQYLIAQNNPNLLDAAIALYSFPDMVTQSIYVLDCEPLEYFFDVTDSDNEKWRQWENRQWILGLTARSGKPDPVSQLYSISSLLNGRIALWSKGKTECTASWRGLVPLIHNPRYAHFMNRVTPEVARQVDWSHWDDLKYFYGTDSDGFALPTWDNVGVQYGLQALTQGDISVKEFLTLNATVGGWTDQRQMRQERYWKLAGNKTPLRKFSPWSQHNFLKFDDGQIAPRGKADTGAIRAAYRSGHVFVGEIDIPVIDIRHYLDNKLDMHHASASLSARYRMDKARGHHDNQLVWISAQPYSPIKSAYQVLEDWLSTGIKPDRATDACFDKDGNVLASGDHVWDGWWNGKPDGPCQEIYPANGTPRSVSGAGIGGDIYQCHLQSVEQALASNVYDPINMRPHAEQMQRIFPDGVCDYSLGDRARPDDLLTLAPTKKAPGKNQGLNSHGDTSAEEN